jgi:hypothetical protein
MYRLDTPGLPGVSTKVRVRGSHPWMRNGGVCPQRARVSMSSRSRPWERPCSVAFAYRRRCFSSAAPKKNQKTQERKASTRHRTRRRRCAGGKDYDDVAKVGTADRGNFRPDEQAHKDKARLGPPFQLQAARQRFRRPCRRHDAARRGPARRITAAPHFKQSSTPASRRRGSLSLALRHGANDVEAVRAGQHGLFPTTIPDAASNP